MTSILIVQRYTPALSRWTSVSSGSGSEFLLISRAMVVWVRRESWPADLASSESSCEVDDRVENFSLLRSQESATDLVLASYRRHADDDTKHVEPQLRPRVRSATKPCIEVKAKSDDAQAGGEKPACSDIASSSGSTASTPGMAITPNRAGSRPRHRDTDEQRNEAPLVRLTIVYIPCQLFPNERFELFCKSGHHGLVKRPAKRRGQGVSDDFLHCDWTCFGSHSRDSCACDY
jgi:hypothetical protein